MIERSVRVDKGKDGARILTRQTILVALGDAACFPVCDHLNEDLLPAFVLLLSTTADANRAAELHPLVFADICRAGGGAYLAQGDVDLEMNDVRSDTQPNE